MRSPSSTFSHSDIIIKDLCCNTDNHKNDQSSVSPAVNCDRSVLTKLLLCFLHMSNEFYKAFTGTWYSLLRPVSELELPYGSRLPVLDVDK